MQGPRNDNTVRRKRVYVPSCIIVIPAVGTYPTVGIFWKPHLTLLVRPYWNISSTFLSSLLLLLLISLLTNRQHMFNNFHFLQES